MTARFIEEACRKIRLSRLQNLPIPLASFTFSLKFYTFSLKVYTFNLKFYTFRLKV